MMRRKVAKTVASHRVKRRPVKALGVIIVSAVAGMAGAIPLMALAQEDPQPPSELGQYLEIQMCKEQVCELLGTVMLPTTTTVAPTPLGPGTYVVGGDESTTTTTTTAAPTTTVESSIWCGNPDPALFYPCVDPEPAESTTTTEPIA